MSVEIKKVSNESEKKQFIDFPHDLYKDDPYYVPEIYLAMKEHLSEKKNPFFKHSEAHLYLAWKDNKIIGRIAAVYNTNYNAFHNCNVAFFGFFDCINDQSTANALFDVAMKHAKEKKATAIYGPTNFSTNDTAGLLVEGFDSSPVIQMTYNFPYYVQLVENYGFTKDMDMFAYWLPTDGVNLRSLELAEKLTARLSGNGITFRNFDLKKNFKREVNNVREIYKSAWEKNWGFVPPTNEEFDFLAEGLKLVLDERFAFVCEDKGRMVGFAVALPDVNEIMKDVKKGRLLPFGIFKLLFGKKKTKKVRIILLGVIEEYRRIGIEAVLYSKMIAAAKTYGKTGGEASWILESNEMMVKGAENLNGQKYKTYRIYTKAV